MSRILTGIGLILLLVVMAIVMMLTARAWKEVTPTAIEVTNPQPATPNPSSKEERPEVIQGSGPLPNLQEMKQNTRQHTRQVEDLQEQIDDQ
jgi:hypothetical protein